MKKKLTRHPNVAFYLDEAALRRIVACVEEFQEVKGFDVAFSDESEICYETLNEVLQIPNVKPREITGITISTRSRDDGDIYLKLDQAEYFGGQAFPPVYYSIEGEEKDVSFIAGKLDEVLAQAKSWYSSFAFRGLGLILLILLGVIFLLVLLGVIDRVIVSENDESTSNSGIYYALLVWLILIPVASWLQPKLFPAAVFAIGDGLRRYEQVKTIRRIVFGTVLGGIGLAVISAFVINLLGL